MPPKKEDSKETSPPPPFEIDLDEKAFAPANPIDRTAEDMAKMKEQFNNLQQLVFNKGLDVGVPRRIRDSINKLVGMLNRIDSVWDSKENKRKEQEVTDKVEIAINKGNLPSAIIYLKGQVMSYKEDMQGVRMFLNVLTFEMNNLSNELEKQGK